MSPPGGVRTQSAVSHSRPGGLSLLFAPGYCASSSRASAGENAALVEPPAAEWICACATGIRRIRRIPRIPRTETIEYSFAVRVR